jgi:hypothetical protein
MPSNTSAFSPERLARISAQLERMDSREQEWAFDPRPETPAAETALLPSWSPNRARREDRRWRKENKRQWDVANFGVILNRWRQQFERLKQEMRHQSKSPFSLRTQQISVLCAFALFVMAILIAGLNFMPRLPTLSLWEKITYFIALPIFLAMAGALAGFVIGVMFDSIERQSEARNAPGNDRPSSGSDQFAHPGQGVRGSVWVSTADLEPNQRVAETVVGGDGNPLLLKHTLLKPSHIEMLRSEGIDRVKVEVMKYPAEGEMAMAG